MALVQFQQGLFAGAPTTASFTGGIYWAEDTHQIGVRKDASTYVWYGGNVKNASLANSVLTITLNEGNPVVLDFSDVASASAMMQVFSEINTKLTTINSSIGVINSSIDTINSSLTNKVDKVNGKQLSTNDFTNALKTKLDGIATGAQVNVIETVKVNGAALVPDASKSVNVVIPAATVTGVAAGDKILSLSNKNISSTLNLTYDSSTKKINLTGVGGIVISTVDAADFIKDGMLESAVFDPSTMVLTLTFNTASGKDPIQIDLSDLVDTYTAGNGLALSSAGQFSIKLDPSGQSSNLTVGSAGLKLVDVATTAALSTTNTNVSNLTSRVTNVESKNTAQDSSITTNTNNIAAIKKYTVNGIAISTNPVLDASKIDLSTGYVMPASYVAPAIGDNLSVAIGKLARGIVTAQASGVTSIGGQAGAITVRSGLTANGSVNLTMSGKELQASIVGLGTAAYQPTSAFDAAGAAGAVLGVAADTSTKITVYGGRKYADYTATTAKNQVIGSTSDASTASTVNGAKKYASDLVTANKLAWIEL